MSKFNHRKKALIGILCSLIVLILVWLVFKPLSIPYVAPIKEKNVQIRPWEKSPPSIFDKFIVSFQPKPKELRLLAKDWQSLSFQTTEDYSPDAEGGIWGITWGSGIHAYTPYLKIEVNSLVGERNTEGGFSISTENARIRIFDVTELEIEPRLDSLNYYLKFSGATGTINIQNAADLTNNKSLEQGEIYNSKLPKNLSLQIDPDNENDLLFRPSVTFFSGDSGRFYSLFRSNSLYTYYRKFDNSSQLDNLLEAVEEYDYPAWNSWPVRKEVIENNIKYSNAHYIVDQIQNKTPGVFILSQALHIFVDEKEIPTREERTYLILATTEKDLDIRIVPTDYRLYYSMNVFPPKEKYEGSLVTIRPISKQLSISGAIGKTSIGTNTITTDELSYMTIDVSETNYLQSDLAWQSQVTTNELGEPSLQQFLVLKTIADRVNLNGQEMIPKYWESLSPELKGAIIGGLIALFGTFFNLLIDRLKKTEPPVVNVTVPVPTINIIQEEKQFLNSTRRSLMRTLIDLIQTFFKKQ